MNSFRGELIEADEDPVYRCREECANWLNVDAEAERFQEQCRLEDREEAQDEADTHA